MPDPLSEAVFDAKRLDALRKTGLLEADQEQPNFDNLTRRAVAAAEAEGGFVSLVSDEGQFLRGCIGLPEPLASERQTPLSHSICAYTIGQDDPLVVEDITAHPLLAGHPAVEAYGIRAYLGIPLHNDEGYTLGTFCVYDDHPRPWTEQQIEAVLDLSVSAETEIELRTELTRRREAERALRDRNETLDAMLDHIADVVTVLEADGTIAFESPAVEEVLGYPETALLGREVWDLIHPEDRPRMRDLFRKALEDPELRPAGEFRYRTADGEYRKLESTGRRLPEEVEIGDFLAVSRDVTETRELKERVRLLGKAVDRAASGVIITGPELDPPGPRIQYVNPALREITGYDREELIGENPRIFQGPKTNREDLDEVRHHLEAGEPVRAETVNYRKDGSHYHVRWQIAPIRDEAGNITHWVSVQEDVTAEKEREAELERRVRERTNELRRAKERAEEMDRLKTAFLQNMSHEIRTPLTGIIGYADLLKSEAPEELSEYIGLIQDSGGRLLTTLDSLLDLAQIESGTRTLRPKPFDAAKYAREAAEELARTIKSDAVDLQVEPADRAVRAEIDPDLFDRVCRNLIHNAFKFTSEGHVRVTVSASAEHLHLEVADTGVGMDETDRDTLFEAFRQESEGQTRAYEGIGIGLTIVQRLADLAGGSIDIDSMKGEGTTVRASLPRRTS